MTAQEQYCDELEHDLKLARRIIDAVENMYFYANDNGMTAQVDAAKLNDIAGMIADFNREREAKAS